MPPWLAPPALEGAQDMTPGDRRRWDRLEYTKAKGQRDRLADERDAVRRELDQAQRKRRGMDRLLTVGSLKEKYSHLSRSWSEASIRCSRLAEKLGVSG
jgi:hypothetical protein